jgi:hypothetical protein
VPDFPAAVCALQQLKISFHHRARRGVREIRHPPKTKNQQTVPASVIQKASSFSSIVNNAADQLKVE